MWGDSSSVTLPQAIHLLVTMDYNKFSNTAGQSTRPFVRFNKNFTSLNSLDVFEKEPEAPRQFLYTENRSFVSLLAVIRPRRSRSVGRPSLAHSPSKHMLTSNYGYLRDCALRVEFGDLQFQDVRVLGQTLNGTQLPRKSAIQINLDLHIDMVGISTVYTRQTTGRRQVFSKQCWSACRVFVITFNCWS